MLMKVNFSPSYINEIEDILLGAIDAKYKMMRKLPEFIKEAKDKGLSNRDIALILDINERSVRNKE